MKPLIIDLAFKVYPNNIYAVDIWLDQGRPLNKWFYYYVGSIKCRRLWLNTTDIRERYDEKKKKWVKM